MRWSALSLGALASILLIAPDASAYGEESGGFPKWSERVLLEWANRARVEPAIEMAACGAACGEKARVVALLPADRAARLGAQARTRRALPRRQHAEDVVLRA